MHSAQCVSKPDTVQWTGQRLPPKTPHTHEVVAAGAQPRPPPAHCVLPLAVCHAAVCHAIVLCRMAWLSLGRHWDGSPAQGSGLPSPGQGEGTSPSLFTIAGESWGCCRGHVAHHQHQGKMARCCLMLRRSRWAELGTSPRTSRRWPRIAHGTNGVGASDGRVGSIPKSVGPSCVRH